MPYADGPDWLVARRGTAFNSFTNIVERLTATPDFELRTGAHALTVEWSGTRRRVEAVVYHDRHRGRTERVAADAVVVACGALNSTKLLFDSACPDFPDGLGNTEGLLGQFLHDHPRSGGRSRRRARCPGWRPASYLTRRPYEVSAPLMATSWTIGNASRWEKALSFTPLKTGVFGVQVFGTMVPTPKNHVRPSPDRRDEFGMAQLEICIDFDKEALENIIDARQHLLSLMEAAGYPCTLHPVVPQLFPGSAVHYGGTARMHRCRDHGVLDAVESPLRHPQPGRDRFQLLHDQLGEEPDPDAHGPVRSRRPPARPGPEARMRSTAVQYGGSVIETRPERTRYHKDVTELEADHPWFRILERVPVGARVLDVGCGSGELGSLLSTRPARVDGLEMNADRAESARRHLRRVVTGTAGPSADGGLDREYDVIVFADVIEHIAVPRATLRWAGGKLAPDGRIIALIPNSANWKFRRKILWGDWSYEETGYFDRDHVRFFDIRTTRELGLRCGLAELDVHYVADKLPKPVNTWRAGAAVAARKRPNLFASHTLIVWQARSGS